MAKIGSSLALASLQHQYLQRQQLLPQPKRRMICKETKKLIFAGFANLPYLPNDDSLHYTFSNLASNSRGKGHHCQWSGKPISLYRILCHRSRNLALPDLSTSLFSQGTKVSSDPSTAGTLTEEMALVRLERRAFIG